MKRNQRVKERIDDGNRIETSSLRPPTRENLRDNASQSGNENSRNARSRRARGVDDGIPPRRPSSPFSKEGENDHVSGKDEQLGYIFIDDKSQEDNQENVSAAQLQQEQYPGAVVVQGPRLGSVERGSIASGTIVVGEDNQNQRSSSIPSRNPIPNVIVAAEVAPTEEEIIARMDEMERRVREHTRQTESTMERRVREQVQQVLQQTPRAEILHLDSDRDRTPASMEEGNDIRTDIKDEVPNKNVQTLTPNGRAVSSEGSQDNLCRRRLICLIGAFTLVIAIAITVAIILTRDDNKSCSVDSDCSFNHAEGNCINGRCSMSACNANYADCNGKSSDGCEIDLQSNVQHCGICNNICNLTNANAECVEGNCVIKSCRDGFSNCDGDSTKITGCEVDLRTDVNNCGFCGNTCYVANGNPRCVQGKCVIDSCDDGFATCATTSNSSCDVNLQTNKYHCGSCGNACDLSNANSKCVEGECAIESCKNDFANCDGKSNTGCEVNLETDVNNCGTCGKSCNLPNAAESKCEGGQCTIKSCKVGFADCDGMPTSGCEIDLQTAVNHCGSCGNSCNLPNAYSFCNGGICFIDSCLSGFADCDDASSTGCEMNLDTNVNNCGSCGNVCTVLNGNSKCVDGSCAIMSCLPGYGDCDGDYSTGCEVSLFTNENHCGSCNTKCNTNNSCMNGICVLQSTQRDALMSLYDSTDGPNWYTDAQENWGSSSVHECLWHGVQCINGKVTELAKGVENLDGTLPTELGLLTGLTYLYFWSNKLSGTIPSALAQLTKLTLLTLSGNELVGGIPTEFGRLTNMRSFFVSNNQLTGQFPSEIAKMTKLTWMHIENNDFTSIPPEVCSKSYSRFSGDCPPCYLGCCTACE